MCHLLQPVRAPDHGAREDQCRASSSKSCCFELWMFKNAHMHARSHRAGGGGGLVSATHRRCRLRRAAWPMARTPGSLPARLPPDAPLPPPQRLRRRAGPLPAQLLPRLLQAVVRAGQEELPHLPRRVPLKVCGEPPHQHSAHHGAQRRAVAPGRRLRMQRRKVALREGGRVPLLAAGARQGRRPGQSQHGLPAGALRWRRGFCTMRARMAPCGGLAGRAAGPHALSARQPCPMRPPHARRTRAAPPRRSAWPSRACARTPPRTTSASTTPTGAVARGGQRVFPGVRPAPRLLLHAVGAAFKLLTAQTPASNPRPSRAPQAGRGVHDGARAARGARQRGVRAHHGDGAQRPLWAHPAGARPGERQGGVGVGGQWRELALSMGARKRRGGAPGASHALLRGAGPNSAEPCRLNRTALRRDL